MNIHPMWNSYPQIKKELQDTLQVMEKNITLKNKEVTGTIIRMIHSGGKLLRPAYQLLFSQFGSHESQEKKLLLQQLLRPYILQRLFMMTSLTKLL